MDKEYEYEQFTDWLHEMEGFAMRAERMYEMFGHKLSNEEWSKLKDWMNAAFYAGREEKHWWSKE